MTARDPIREAIEAELVVEREGWAAERVARVAERLQRGVPAADRLDALVLWSDSHNAFTTPGRTVYISRRLLERLPDDDATAFVIAHEIAHHRLGHVPAQWRPLRTLLRLGLTLGLELVERWIASEANEADADALAIQLCLDAGYDAERCLAALQHFEQVALDYGDVDAVLGPEADGVHDCPSHPPVRARLAAARARAAAHRRGERVSPDLSRDRLRARRKRAAAVAGSLASAAAAFLLLRRLPR